MQYLVRRMWRVTADRPDEAVEKAVAEPDSVLVSEDSLEARVGFERQYTQPIEVLDSAWDAFHERNAMRSLGELPDDAMAMPGIVDLATAGLELPQISLLFDLAITAYRERFEPDGRRVP